MDSYERLWQMVESLNYDVIKFEKGMDKPGVRLRKDLKEVIHLAKDMQQDIQDTRKLRKKKPS